VIEVFFRCTARPRSDRGFTGFLPVHCMHVPAVIEVSLVYFRCTMSPQ
jgi:hypothetical protein